MNQYFSMRLKKKHNSSEKRAQRRNSKTTRNEKIASNVWRRNWKEKLGCDRNEYDFKNKKRKRL